jgi:hypothetical protein
MLAIPELATLLKRQKAEVQVAAVSALANWTEHGKLWLEIT